MPKDFNFICYHDYDIINTFDSTFKRKGIKGSNDYIQDTVIRLILTTAEKGAIYNVMMKNRILEMPKEFECDPNTTEITDQPTDFLEVRLNDTTKRIKYYYGCKTFKSKLSNNFIKIIESIADTIYSKREIKALPKSNLFLP